ncbi:serine/arginine repetitive matrix protein 1-like [Meriones unguiculatus]|uniref:serine/arginine repetitive matrix protein 1-like n=1 Tax=Meriones unguiculatus TaxID=10047 RepID=UPI00293F6F87|nr:serine/arginine repetitive matrix protein 1-like [Meriones unguiculatus]
MGCKEGRPGDSPGGRVSSAAAGLVPVTERSGVNPPVAVRQAPPAPARKRWWRPRRIRPRRARRRRRRGRRSPRTSSSSPPPPPTRPRGPGGQARAPPLSLRQRRRLERRPREPAAGTLQRQRPPPPPPPSPPPPRAALAAVGAAHLTPPPAECEEEAVPPPPLPPPELPAMGGGRPHWACAPRGACSVTGPRLSSRPHPLRRRSPPPSGCGCPEAGWCRSDARSAAPGFTSSPRKSLDRAGEAVSGGVLLQLPELKAMAPLHQPPLRGLTHNSWLFPQKPACLPSLEAKPSPTACKALLRIFCSCFY